MNPTLSNYFPPDTTYFYGYPAGNDSRFYNSVPPFIEELVSARPLVCAGPTMRIIAFSATTRDDMLRLLVETGTDLPSPDRIIRLPDALSADVTGERRNTAIIDALTNVVPDGSLVMAQPYDRESLRTKYRIPLACATAMNDKLQMRDWVPAEFLPQTITTFADGRSFAQCNDFPLPCVIKLSNSSAGDGVRVCRTMEDIIAAKETFSSVREPIFIQEYIDATENYGVQFGIPADPAQPIDIIGMSRQITSPAGEFLGGIVLRNDPVPEELAEPLREQILPRAREQGWFGVGGIDVLKSAESRYYLHRPEPSDDRHDASSLRIHVWCGTAEHALPHWDIPGNG